MRNLEPCPSPMGTNYERLFIIRKPARMAMDEEMPDLQDNGSGSDGDLADKIRELLVGKLDDSVIEELLSLIVGDPQDGPVQQPPGIATDAAIRRYLAKGAQARAKLSAAQRADLIKRFPGLSNARVI
jgi:hypothetical protein